MYLPCQHCVLPQRTLERLVPINSTISTMIASLKFSHRHDNLILARSVNSRRSLRLCYTYHLTYHTIRYMACPNSQDIPSFSGSYEKFHPPPRFSPTNSCLLPAPTGSRREQRLLFQTSIEFLLDALGYLSSPDLPLNQFIESLFLHGLLVVSLLSLATGINDKERRVKIGRREYWLGAFHTVGVLAIFLLESVSL